MTDILKPGSGFIYMKVGTHAGEELEDIVERKQREIRRAGYALWGYGGNTCHPFNMVQPFAEDFVRKNGEIFLVMQPMQSRHFATPARATEMSRDGVNWERVPDGIDVLGSRYALAIGDLEREEFDLALSNVRVARGMSAGRRGDRYIQGHVDKGCFEIDEGVGDVAGGEKPVRIGLVARLIDPYAVLVRG